MAGPGQRGGGRRGPDPSGHGRPGGTEGPGLDPAPRQQARERAVSLLYEAELKGVAPSEVLDALPVPADPFAAALVERVESGRPRLDELVAGASIGWPLERMPVVDRIILRLAVAELLDPEGPPVAVVIDQAVRLATTYSTEDSGRFVNGVLSTVARSVGRGEEGGRFGA